MSVSRRGLLLSAGGGIAALGLLMAAGGARNLYYAAITEDTTATAIGATQAHAAALAGEIYLIDIRRPEEWAASGSGEGAIRLDMRRDDFTEALQEIVAGDRAAPIALICARGVRSARLSNRLIAEGFTNIIDVPEGMFGSAQGPGWHALGLPVDRS